MNDVMRHRMMSLKPSPAGWVGVVSSLGICSTEEVWAPNLGLVPTPEAKLNLDPGRRAEQCRAEQPPCPRRTTFLLVKGCWGDLMF